MLTDWPKTKNPSGRLRGTLIVLSESMSFPMSPAIRAHRPESRGADH